MAHTRCKVPLTPILLLWWNTLLLLPANVVIELSVSCLSHARAAAIQSCRQDAHTEGFGATACNFTDWEQQLSVLSMMIFVHKALSLHLVWIAKATKAVMKMQALCL